MQRITMDVHPIEARFLLHLRRYRFGVIKEVKVEDGLPMLAEFIHERVRFDRNAEEK